MARERRGKLRKPKKVGDLKARVGRAGAVKGGIVINWAQQTAPQTSGINAAMGDGSVRFVSSAVSVQP